MVNIIKYVTVKIPDNENDEDKEEVIKFCPECNCEDLIKDFNRLEVYCSKCGLVVQSLDINKLNEMKYMKKLKEKEKKQGKKRKRKIKG